MTAEPDTLTRSRKVFDLEEITRAVLRRALAAATLGGLAALTCAAIAWKITPPAFEATVHVQVAGLRNYVVVPTSGLSHWIYLNTQADLLVRSHVLRDALERAQSRSPDVKELTVADFRACLKVEVSRDSEIVMLSVTHANRDISIALADAWAASYVDEANSSDRKEIESRIATLEAESETADHALEQSFSDLKTLANELGAVDVPLIEIRAQVDMETRRDHMARLRQVELELEGKSGDDARESLKAEKASLEDVIKEIEARLNTYSGVRLVELKELQYEHSMALEQARTLQSTLERWRIEILAGDRAMLLDAAELNPSPDSGTRKKRAALAGVIAAATTLLAIALWDLLGNQVITARELKKRGFSPLGHPFPLHRRKNWPQWSAQVVAANLGQSVPSTICVIGKSVESTEFASSLHRALSEFGHRTIRIVNHGAGEADPSTEAEERPTCSTMIESGDPKTSGATPEVLIVVCDNGTEIPTLGLIDAAVIVLRSGELRRQQFADEIQILRQMGIRLLGVAIG